MPKRSAPSSNGGPLQKKAKTNPQPGRSQRTAIDSNGALSYAATAQTRVRVTGQARVAQHANGDCVISHREYIQDIVAASGSPSAFSVNSFAINAGQSGTFPWLSLIAQRFESYRFEKLRFCYETEAPATLGGSLVMSVDYDASDPAPQTKQQAMAYRRSVRSAPWKECCHESLAEDLHKKVSNFVRPGAQPANTDIKEYDIGNLNVITQNATSASAVCGELYVEYTVRLMTPVIEAAGVTAGVLTNAAGTGVASATPLGTALVNTGSLISGSTSSVVSLQNLIVGAEYQLVYSAVGTTITPGASPFGVTGLTLVSSGTSATAVSIRGSMVATAIATASTGTVTPSVTLAVPTAAFFTISQLPISAF